MVASVLKQIRNTVAIAALAVAVASPAAAFSVDGKIEKVVGVGLEYTNTIDNVRWFNGHGDAGWGDFDTPLGTTTIFYRIVENSLTDFSLFVGADIPIEAKNTIWNEPKDGTLLAEFTGYGENLNFDKATKSEKMIFLGSASTAASTVELLKGDLAKGLGGASESGAGTLEEYADSVDYLTTTLGDGGDGVLTTPFCTTNADCFGTTALGTTMAFEFRIDFASNALASAFVTDFTKIEVHLSPPRCLAGTGKSSVQPCAPGGPPPPPGVPEPSTLAIFGLGLVGLGFMRRRRRFV